MGTSRVPERMMTASPAPGGATLDLLTLQKAIVVVHRRAQRLHALRVWLMIAAGIAGVAGGLAGGVASTAAWAKVGALAAALAPLALSWLLATLESAATARAAVLQHRYDTDVLGLADTAFVPDPDPAEVARLALRWSGDEADEANLQAWYLDTARLPRWKAVMFSQRMNLVWDVDQRRHLAWLALPGGFALLGAGALVAILVDWGLTGWLAGWVGPTAGVTQLTIEMWFRHTGLANDKERLAADAWRLIAGDDPARPDEQDAAELQLELLGLRRRASRVPGWLQDRSRERLRRAAQRELDDLVAVLQA